MINLPLVVIIGLASRSNEPTTAARSSYDAPLSSELSVPMLRMAMWSKAALTLESLENRSMPCGWLALNRPLAARIA